MLTEFHFDEELLSCDEIISEVSHALNISLLEFWYERGCLVFPYSHLIKYKEWMQYIHPKYIQKWQAALASNLTVDMPNGYRMISEYEDFNALTTSCVSNGIDLVLVPGSFDKLGITSDNDFYSDVIDITKVGSFLSSPVINRNKIFSTKGILPGEDINDIWEKQFLKVAKHSKKITIIDRYFGKNLCDDILIETPLKKTCLHKFIELLSVANKKFNVNILTVGDGKNSQMHLNIETYARRLLQKPGVGNTISSLTISSCDDIVFRDHSHERYLCFESFVYKIDRGMKIFSPFPQVATSISVDRNIAGSTFNHALQELMKKRLWVY
ncbi:MULTISPECIES: hypothetical protein [unclassified Enterobacter]|uniref:hypothetical protein n=1 Tax=unclassified Enterobacter TaxID=2608935 RepID=UPI002366F314|nr:MULTISPECIES: hypothetical protein [unclassified Enterobacter]